MTSPEKAIVATSLIMSFAMILTPHSKFGALVAFLIVGSTLSVIWWPI